MDSKRVKRFKLKKQSRVIKKHARRIEETTKRHAHHFVISRWDRIREVRFHIIIWMGSVGLLIALVGLQMVWFQQSYITKAPVSGGTYAEALRGPLGTLNPLFASTPAELAVSHLLFSSLYSVDTTGHVKGDIATGMTVRGDKQFTITLRHDAHWQDGQKLTADDVTYTVGLMKNPSVRKDLSASWQGINVQRVDEYTVRFTLPTSYAAFPQALTFAILPEHILAKTEPTALRESSYSTSPVGSGPFKLRLLQVISKANDRKIAHMDANEDYYGGVPRLEHLQVHTYKDNESIALALKTGEVTGAAGATSDVASGLPTGKYDAEYLPLNEGVYAILNTTQPLLKDISVRRALLAATDTTAIRHKIPGNPRELHLPFIARQVNGSESLPAPQYSLDTASRILDKAGWRMVNGVRMKGDDRLRLAVVTRKNVDYETALESLAGQWRKIGIQVDTQIFDTNDPTQNFATDVLQRRSYDVLLDQLVIGTDPDVFAYWHSRGLLNFANYSDQDSDDALASARTTSDTRLRDLKYISFAKKWMADVPAIGLYEPNLIYIHSKSTEAVQPDEVVVSADKHYANVLYWTADRGSVYKTP